ncbi:MAG: glycosyltransferase family 39 protein [Candidatus Harrisonbacteria bacterium]|nr:glycosyltransferase family 39 protein [Candidatus Harrisonbacteria bacterium]
MFTIFGYKITEKQVLIAILFLAALLRFWGLGSSEFYHDEGFTAFRSIGYLDYIQNDDQTAPIQWFKDAAVLPWWTHLSFHDHPPLFFLIQNLFFKIFGNSLFVARLPSAIAGILSIYLVYLLSERVFINSLSKFFAPLLLSLSLIHIWISRSSLFESVQIFFILLNIYYFFKLWGGSTSNGGRTSKDWWLFGMTLGLAFLTKYTSIFLVPVYLTYWTYKTYWTNRSDRTDWAYLFSAFGLAFLLFSPVLIYNFYLWQTVGHFDLQFAYVFNQPTPEWRASLGKIQDPFSEIISNLTLMYSIPFLLAALTGIGWAAYRTYKSYRTNKTNENYLIFWLLNFIFITLMLIKIGSAFRFIVLYAAPAAMLIAYFFDYLYSKFHKEVLFKILLVTFLAYELFFAIDIFLTFPDFGIAALDHYFDVELGQKRSLAIPASSNPHLDRLLKMNARRIPASEKSTIIIYDENIALSPRLWVFTRRTYYSGFPSFTVTQFKNFLKDGASRFDGYDIYFAKASRKTYLNPIFHSNAAEDLELFLNQELRLSPVKTIYGYDNLLMFTVYKFKL